MLSGDFKTQVEELNAFLVSGACQKLLTRFGESDAIFIGTNNCPEFTEFEAVWLSKNGLCCFSGDLDDWRLYGTANDSPPSAGYRPGIAQDAVMAFRHSRRDQEAKAGRELSSVVDLLTHKLG